MDRLLSRIDPHTGPEVISLLALLCPENDTLEIVWDANWLDWDVTSGFGGSNWPIWMRACVIFSCCCVLGMVEVVGGLDGRDF